MGERHSERCIAELERAFDQAVRARGCATNFARIGGGLVRFRFAGEALRESLMPALGHLVCEEGEPELTISVADSESTGARPVLTPGTDALNGGECTSSERCIFVPDSDAIYALDLARRSAFFWVRASSALKPWDLTAPFRPLFGWLAENKGAQLAHGAVVGVPGSAILFAGPGGAGKSTLTLACVESGLLTLGDDYVWIESDGRRAYSLYSTVKVRRSALGAPFRAFSEYARGLDGERAVLFLSGLSERFAEQMPIRAVAAVRIVKRPFPRVTRASRMAALTALAPSSLLQLPGSTSAGLERLGQLVRAVPTFTFEAGSDYAANARGVAVLLRELAQGSEESWVKSMGAGP